MTQVTEIPIAFDCEGYTLYGIAHLPQVSKRSGVLIVVGGPQYRVGSHRQFLLLARELANHGFPVMRFDYTGMGDAQGDQKTFDNIDADLNAAIEAFYQQQPSLKSIVIWGLCDAASAALFYAYQDQRVKGLVLLNPWVYTSQGSAKTYLKYYYLQRIVSRELWTKILSGKFNVIESLSSLFLMVKETIQPVANADNGNNGRLTDQLVSSELPLPERMKQCWQRFQYPVLCILSGNDLTASEFRDVVAADTEWQQLFKQDRLTRQEFHESDHTFSRAVWRDQVAEWTIDWLDTIERNQS